MTQLLAIDPGTTESAWLEYELETRMPIEWAKVPNGQLLEDLGQRWLTVSFLTIEMVASYGKPVGVTTFQTCVWIGRFIEGWRRGDRVPSDPVMIERPDVKLHLCGSRNKVTDAVIRQRLIDLYGPSEEQAVGRKAAPGPLYGMNNDCRAALALAITAAETTPRQSELMAA